MRTLRTATRVFQRSRNLDFAPANEHLSFLALQPVAAAVKSQRGSSGGSYADDEGLFGGASNLVP